AQYVTAIKNKNIDGMLSCYSDNFLHLSDDSGTVETKTYIKDIFSKYNYASAEGTVWTVNSINISAMSATVSVTCKTVLDGITQENETYTKDRLCFLKKENGKWLITGNQKQWALSGFTAHSPGKYFVEFYLNEASNTDASKEVASVVVSGPGVTQANATMKKPVYSWMSSKWAPDPMPEFGGSKPSSNLMYNFSINIAGTVYNDTLDLGNEFVEGFPLLVSPADSSAVSVSDSKYNFTWKPVDSVKVPNAVYHVELSYMNYTRIWDGAGDSALTSSTYTDTDHKLLAGQSYRWLVVTKKQGSGNISLTNSFTFTVQ
ncbi:MAG TPA: nuclear transport factor 2 family protein, partial [Candidatus Wallbacteria bacterium]|nr:nuclear transport factor 2 family protein [Candidatus Wallbacteria bacterium]